MIALDEDFHVHSACSDGAATLAENVEAARARGLRTLCLVDHVRRDTGWLPSFTAAVSCFRGQPGPRVLAGVEAEILDGSGTLDLPPLPDGIDLVLIAGHRFPGVAGPLHPDEVRAALADRKLYVTEAIEQLCEATALAFCRVDRQPLLAHLFSLLPKIGLDETMVPEPLLAHLAKRIAHAGTLVEVNEKWSCPSARTVRALARAGVSLVAGSGGHHCREIGVYRSVRLTSQSLTTMCTT